MAVGSVYGSESDESEVEQARGKPLGRRREVTGRTRHVPTFFTITVKSPKSIDISSKSFSYACAVRWRVCSVDPYYGMRC
jgi:hypothetical protein